MVHLTVCSPEVGHPLCECGREEATKRGETFVSSLDATDEFFASPNSCPDCMEVYWRHIYLRETGKEKE